MGLIDDDMVIVLNRNMEISEKTAVGSMFVRWGLVDKPPPPLTIRI